MFLFLFFPAFEPSVATTVFSISVPEGTTEREASAQMRYLFKFDVVFTLFFRSLSVVKAMS